jgi:uncharacterized protein YkwD
MKPVVLVISLLLHSWPTYFQRQPDVVIERLEQRVFERINDERVSRKLPPLKPDSRLSAIARDHSKDMAAKGYIAHVNKEGLDPTQRAQAAGYKCSRVIGRVVYSGVAENIFQNNLYGRKTVRGAQVVYEWNNEEKIAASSVKGWMESSGHRANILNSVFAATGIGVAIAPDYRVYITQEFC